MADLEAGLKSLKDRCASLANAARTYRDGLQNMHAAEKAFAQAIEDFSGTDEEGLMMGAH